MPNKVIAALTKILRPDLDLSKSRLASHPDGVQLLPARSRVTVVTAI